MAIPTPHINAKEGDFAKTVLMPGDPLRSKFIAETYLENRRLVNDVLVLRNPPPHDDFRRNVLPPRPLIATST